MARRYYSNTSVATTLSSGISPGDTSLTVASATGYPTAPFVIVLEKGTANEENILVGNKAGAVFSSLTRGYDGTSAVAHNAGVAIEHVVTAADFEEMFTHSHLTAGGHTQADHGNLLGNADDDHSQYLNNARHDITARHGSAVVDHGSIGGLLDNDHTQYRLGTADHTHQSAGAQAGPLDHGAALTGLTDDDHTIYVKEIPITFSKVGNLIVETGKHRWYSRYAITLLEFEISVATAPTGAAVICDLNKNGTTVFSTQSNRPQIAISGFVGTTTTFNTATLADGDYLTVDVDQIGSTIAGAELVATIWYRRT